MSLSLRMSQVQPSAAAATGAQPPQGSPPPPAASRSRAPAASRAAAVDGGATFGIGATAAQQQQQQLSSQQVIPPTQTPNSASASVALQQQMPLGSASLHMSQSQRPSAATRRRQAQAASTDSQPAAAPSTSASLAAAPPASASMHVSHTPSVRASLAPPSASAAVPADDAVDATAAAVPTNRRLATSAKDAIAAAGSARAGPATVAVAGTPAVLQPPPPEPVDDSVSFLAPFVLDTPLTSGDEAATPFLLFLHHQPATDLLTLFLLQRGPPNNVPSTTPGALSQSARLYRFSGPLLSLRPHGLYMSGALSDDEYRHYVLNGLSVQDRAQQSFEYELVMLAPDEEDEPELDVFGEPVERPQQQRTPSRAQRSLSGRKSSAAAAAARANTVRAQLKLYKRMGERVTRVPVCIAHIRFSELHLSSLTRSPSSSASTTDVAALVALLPPRQDELEYATGVSALVGALAQWTSRLRRKRAQVDRALQAQSDESKLAEELLAFPTLPPQSNGTDNNNAHGASARDHNPLSPTGVTNSELASVRRELLRQACLLLNGKKAEIRRLRAENDALRQERDALLPKRSGLLRGDDSDSSSSGSDSEDGDHVSAVDSEAKHATSPRLTSSSSELSPSLTTSRMDARTPTPPPVAVPAGLDADGTAAATAALAGGGAHMEDEQGGDESFPASVDPASLSSFSASLLPSVTQSQQQSVLGSPGQRSSSSLQQHQQQHAGVKRSPPAAAPHSGGGGGIGAPEEHLSPPKPQFQVRKRARVNPPPPPSLSQHSPSLPAPSPHGSGGSGGGGPSRRSSGGRTAPAPAPAAAAAAAAARPPVLQRERTSSQMLRELATHQSLVAGGRRHAQAASGQQQQQQQASPPNDAAAAAPGAAGSTSRRMRTQQSAHTSRLLSDME